MNERYTCSGYNAKETACRRCMPGGSTEGARPLKSGWKCYTAGKRVMSVPLADYAHDGDPCRHCGAAAADVQPGPCPTLIAKGVQA